MVRRKADRELAAGQAEATALVEELRQAVAAGENWFLAMLATIGRWRLPEETVDGCSYRYLIGGEAFDWLLLAERLCEGLDGLLPQAEREALLFQGRPPWAIGEEEFRRLIGSAKYRAHLNYIYGVLVEEGLQMVVAEEVQKERLGCVWKNGQRLDDEVCLRIYEATRLELAQRFRQERGLPPGDALSLGELKEFTYWLFKYRLRQCDPARIASDTRKGLAALTRFQAAEKHIPWLQE
ncbi:MAG: hypothetical protein ACE5IZ_11165 [Dehalococcoidia bacterium]